MLGPSTPANRYALFGAASKKCRVQGLDGGRTWDPMIRVSCLYFLINGLDANYRAFWPNKINRLPALTNGSEPADLIKETRSAELREE